MNKLSLFAATTALTLILGLSANAQTTTGFDTANSNDMIFGVNGTQVGDWNNSQLSIATGVSTAGSIGVNTNTPQTELDVVGGIRTGYDGNNCGGNNEGTQRYNTSIHNYEFCNGSSWQPLGSNPTPVSGTWCGAQGAIEGGNYPCQGYYPLSNGCPPGWSQRIFNVYGGGGLGFCIKN